MKKINYIIRSDIALEKKDATLVNRVNKKTIKIKTFKQDKFHFTNIICPHIETRENKENLTNILKEELTFYLNKHNITKDNSALIIGLGNENITSDALGPKTIEKVKATAYLKNLNMNLNIRSISTFTPRTLIESGIMPFNSIKALINEIKPDFLIIIDALLCSKVQHLCKLIQLTDIGITPGSGIHTYEEELSQNTLNIPVIVIGLATVTHASTIIKDALKLKGSSINYQEGYDFLVSKKDIDITINVYSRIISNCINQTLNPNTYLL